MKRQKITDSIIVVVTFLFAFYGKQILTKFIDIPFQSFYGRMLYSYLWWLIPVLLAVGYLFGFRDVFKNIGLQKGFLTGLLFSVVAVLPMLISSAVVGQLNEDLDMGSLIHKTAIAGFMEEFLFRGFLFGILFRKLGWGFVPASILGAMIFGIGHIYQGSTFLEMMGVFFVTAAGAVWLAWLFIEWDGNLWVPIFLHILMNLSWVLFEVSNNALGGFYSNLFRLITIAMTVVVTIYYHKKRGLRISKNNLIVNDNNSIW